MDVNLHGENSNLRLLVKKEVIYLILSIYLFMIYYYYYQYFNIYKFSYLVN